MAKEAAPASHTRIYLDNAAGSYPKEEAVIEAVAQAMRTLGSASRGTHDEALAADEVLYRCRTQVAHFFNLTDPARVIFTQNATHALNLAIMGAIPDGSHVITDAWAHNSVLRPLYLRQARGDISLDILPADSTGALLLDQLETMLQDNTRVLVLTHASNVTGAVLDLDSTAEIACSHGLLLILDASQSAGVIPIDMEQGIGILCLPGHKSLLGPQGTGLMLLNDDVDCLPVFAGGTGVQSYLTTQPDCLPTRLEAGTLNVHALAGLVAGLALLEKRGLADIYRREMASTCALYAALQDLPAVHLYSSPAFATYMDRGRPGLGDRDIGRSAMPLASLSAVQCPLFSFNLGDVGSDLIADALNYDYHICVRAGAHCAPQMHGALGTTGQGTVRVSPSWRTTDADIAAFACAMHEISERLQKGAP